MTESVLTESSRQDLPLAGAITNVNTCPLTSHLAGAITHVNICPLTSQTVLRWLLSTERTLAEKMLVSAKCVASFLKKATWL